MVSLFDDMTVKTYKPEGLTWKPSSALPSMFERALSLSLAYPPLNNSPHHVINLGNSLNYVLNLNNRLNSVLRQDKERPNIKSSSDLNLGLFCFVILNQLNRGK
jgi:hypothetical protein